MRLRILGLCVLASIQSVAGYAQNSQEIVTDRPDITESSVVVPPGTLQSENDVTWTGDHGTRTLDVSETLLRLGVWSRTEVRIELPNYLGGVSNDVVGFGRTQDFANQCKETICSLRS